MFWKTDGDYLDLAQKAEKAAELAQSPIAKRYWQGIADGYRKLGARKPEPAMQGRRETWSLSEVAKKTG